MIPNNDLVETYKAEFECLAATVPDIIYRIDEEGNFVYLNPAIRMLGWEPGELIGKHFSEIIVPAEVEKVSRKYVLQEYAGKTTGLKAPKLFDERRSGNRMTSQLVVRLMSRDKSKKQTGVIENISQDYVIASVNSSGVYKTDIKTNSRIFIGTVGVIKDVTNQRWMESELIKYSEHLAEMVSDRTRQLTDANIHLQKVISDYRESEETKEAVLENSPVSIYIIQDGRFQYVNSNFLLSMDYTVEQLLGKNPSDIIFPADREDARKNAAWMLERGMAIPYEYRIVDGSGKIRWIMEIIVSIQHKGKRATLGNFIDITERKQTEEKLRKSADQLQKTLDGITRAIAAMVELRDPYTAGHQVSVANLAKAIALEMELPVELANQLYTAGLIHDIGKISIPAEILSKPGKLNDLEYMLIKKHPQAGHDILKNIDFPYPLARWILEHHELLDGSGYPAGLTGDRIALESRIITVADVFEAMSSHRPYRASLGIVEALKEINNNKDRLYDANVVDACLRLNEKGFKFKSDTQ